jgi:hypothetical protein
MQAICKGIFSKMIYCLKRVALQKGDLKMNFKYYFIKYFLRFQRIVLKTLFLFCIMQIKPFWPKLQSFLKILFYFGKLFSYFFQMLY